MPGTTPPTPPDSPLPARPALSPSAVELALRASQASELAARQQVLLLNQQLATANDTLLATNEELRLHNARLRRSQQHLQRLNQTLDARVATGTQAAHTARATAERQHAHFERLLMTAPAAICLLQGPELVHRLVNPSYQRLFPGRQLLGQSLVAALPELAGSRVLAACEQVYAAGGQIEERALCIPFARPADGGWEDRYFNFIQQARPAEDGQLAGVLVFAFEVTEQVRARQASDASAEQLRLLTDALPVLISYLDREQRYCFVNQAYEGWFNQPAPALLGQAVADVVGPAAYQTVKTYIERALAGERVDFEARMPYRAGFVKYIRTSFVPDVQQGQVVGFYSLVSDITEQVLSRQQVQGLNEQLAVSNEELYAANEELGAANDALGTTNLHLTRTNVDLDTFVYTASHDLKAPITNLDGLLRALREELDPAHRLGQVAYIMDLMQGSIDRFQRTITQLSAIGQLQQEHGQPAPPIFLAKVIDDVCLDLASLIAAVSAQVVVEVRGFPSFPFSEKNLRSVVYNLLSNALKYHHPDRVPEVHLLCRIEVPYWVLEVRDNGLGLDLTPERPLFGLFQRYHTHVEGSGVGLYMVKKMLENAGGTITVLSQLGVGSTFTAYFRY